MTSAYTYTDDGILAAHIRLACGHTITATEEDGGMDELPTVGRMTLTRSAQDKALRHAIQGCTHPTQQHTTTHDTQGTPCNCELCNRGDWTGHPPRSTTPDTDTDTPTDTPPPARGRAVMETEHGDIRFEGIMWSDAKCGDRVKAVVAPETGVLIVEAADIEQPVVDVDGLARFARGMARAFSVPSTVMGDPPPVLDVAKDRYFKAVAEAFGLPLIEHGDVEKDRVSRLKHSLPGYVCDCPCRVQP